MTVPADKWCALISVMPSHVIAQIRVQVYRVIVSRCCCVDSPMASCVCSTPATGQRKPHKHSPKTSWFVSLCLVFWLLYRDNKVHVSYINLLIQFDILFAFCTRLVSLTLVTATSGQQVTTARFTSFLWERGLAILYCVTTWTASQICVLEPIASNYVILQEPVCVSYL